MNCKQCAYSGCVKDVNPCYSCKDSKLFVSKCNISKAELERIILKIKDDWN